MALSDYKAETREIALKTGSFHVKGLSLVDITKLIRHHLPDLEALFKLVTEVMDGKHELTPEDLDALAISLAENAPGFVANLIALGELDGKKDQAAIDAAGSLPFPVQIQAISDIADLTFDEVGGLKNALGRVATLLGSNSLKKLASRVKAL